jgi:CHAT domain-containing protein/tetratricopeptide (TPR) repeat protein
MRNHINIFILFLFVSVLCNAQSWNQLETEYKNFFKNKQNDLAVNKAKEIYYWVKSNESDTSLHLPISLKYIGNEFINNDSAIAYYDIALNILKKQKREKHIQSAIIHLLKAQLNRKLEKKETSLIECQIVINIIDNINCRKDTSAIEIQLIIMNGVALNYLKYKEYEKALAVYLKELAVIIKYRKKDSFRYAKVNLNIGSMYLIFSDYINAKNYLIEGFEIEKRRYYSSLNNHSTSQNPELISNYIYALNQMSNLYALTGEYNLNCLLLTEKIKLTNLSKVKDSTNYQLSLIILASSHLRLKHYFQTDSLLNEALSLALSSKFFSKENIAFLKFEYGNFYYKIGDLKLAEKYYNESLESLMKFDEDYFSCLASLLDVYIHLGKDSLFESKYFETIYFINNQLIIDPNNVHFKIYDRHYNFLLASYYNEKEKYDKAEAIYNEIKVKFIRNNKADNEEYAILLNNLADINIRKVKYDNALKLLNEALKILNKVGSNDDDYLLRNLARTYNLLNDKEKCYSIYLNIYNKSLKELTSNIAFFTEDEKANFIYKKTPFFSNIVNFTSNNYNKAPDCANLLYNSLLLTRSLIVESSNKFSESIYSSKDSILIGNYNNMKMFWNLSVKLSSEGFENRNLISKIEFKADSINKIVSRKLNNFNAYKKNFSLTVKDVQTNLNKNEVAIEFSRYYNDSDSSYHYMALLVKLGDKFPQLVKLCKEVELKEYSPETDLYSLYDLVWKPLLPYLINVKTIYYSPSGLLNNIPFQALYKEENGQREYVMDKYSLHQLTSTRYLALDLKKKEQEPIESSIALFGGINYNDYPNVKTDTANHDQSTEAAFLFKNAIVINREIDSTRTGASYLPGTKKEVEIIANVLNAKKWQVDVSEGKNATENKIKSYSGSNSKAILHIATHGFAFPDKEEKRKELTFSMMSGNDKYKASDNPMIRSGLLFGGANMTWQGKGDSLLKSTNEDGVLTAYELSQLDLSNTKLAVLSACETGKGEIQGSEGTFGLKRALKLAGVDNMIVSLWKVPDDATMEMMTLFYTELANTKKPVSSFETAQKAMRLKYPNEPKKWAGFVFVR